MGIPTHGLRKDENSLYIHSLHAHKMFYLYYQFNKIPYCANVLHMWRQRTRIHKGNSLWFSTFKKLCEYNVFLFFKLLNFATLFCHFYFFLNQGGSSENKTQFSSSYFTLFLSHGEYVNFSCKIVVFSQQKLRSKRE